MKKRFIIISVAVACALVTFLFCWLFLPVRLHLDGNETATLSYKVNGKDIQATLSQEETAAVAEILNGKIPLMDIGRSCGFSANVSIRIGGKTYCLAMDKCGSMQIAYTAKYITLTEKERAQIEEIFATYGGKFPCI